MTVTADDLALVEAARDAIAARYRAGWHVVGAAVRLRDGRVFTGVHLEANVGRIAVCAEAIALGRAATEAGSTDIETIVAVWHPAVVATRRDIAIVSPCGMCREMICDYAPDARVLIEARGDLRAMSIRELLPHRFDRPGEA